MTNAEKDLLTIVVRWPGDDTPPAPGVTYVNAEDVQVSARVLRNFGKHRQNNVITVDLATALRLVEAKLIDVTYDETYTRLRAAAADAAETVVQEASSGGDVPKVAGEGEPRPRARASRRRDDAAHGRHDAGNTEPVEGADPGRSGDSAG